jgi:hypothetical protein
MSPSSSGSTVDRGELPVGTVEREALIQDHLGRVTRSEHGDLMADDHVVAVVEEGDLTVVAAGLEDHPQGDHEPSHLGDPTVGAGQGGRAGEHEHDVGAHRRSDHRVVPATERRQQLREESLALGGQCFVAGHPPDRPSGGGA